MSNTDVAADNAFKQSYIDAANPDLRNPALGRPVPADWSKASWEFVRVKRQEGFKEGVACSCCGEWRRGDDEPAHETVRRIVREGVTFSYGAGMVAGGGEVYVEPRHLSGAILETTCSPRQWEAMQAEKHRRHEARAPQLMRNVAAAEAAKAAEAATLDPNERGRLLMEQQFQAQEARHHSVLRRQGRPVDEEDPTPGGRGVR